MSKGKIIVPNQVMQNRKVQDAKKQAEQNKAVQDERNMQREMGFQIAMSTAKMKSLEMALSITASGVAEDKLKEAYKLADDIFFYSHSYFIPKKPAEEPVKKPTDKEDKKDLVEQKIELNLKKE